MVVYSFYIFDRHTECIYSRLWLRQDRLSYYNNNNTNAAIASTSITSIRPTSTSSSVPPGATGVGATIGTATTATTTLTTTTTNTANITTAGIANNNQLHGPTNNNNNITVNHLHPHDVPRNRYSRLSAKDDARLIFGTIYSLRNIVKKLGGQDDSFISYRTGQYKLHYYETPTNVKFVILTDVGTLNMRNVLHQIYVNLYVEYVIKNPLSPVEHKSGKGVANELFELALDQFVKGLL